MINKVSLVLSVSDLRSALAAAEASSKLCNDGNLRQAHCIVVKMPVHYSGGCPMVHAHDCASITPLGAEGTTTNQFLFAL